VSNFRKPEKVLTAVVAAGTEVIRARDARFAAALDVAPPSAEGVPAPEKLSEPESRQIVYRILRKIYRKLLHIGSLRPILHRIRCGLVPLLRR